jgi:hypothetical protein
MSTRRTLDPFQNFAQEREVAFGCGNGFIKPFSQFLFAFVAFFPLD